MELKVPHFAAVISFGVVSIAPLWNWKSQSRMPVSLSICFNRTFMELKGCPAAICGRGCQGFNRTFMELKGRWYTSRSRLSPFQSHLYGIESVNKQIAIFDLAKFQSHLYGIESILYHARTWIATKFQSHLYGIERWWRARRSPALRCFNRTFMELKVSWAVRRAGKRSVSIAPLWNWKVVALQLIGGHDRFNRTFMELKDR